LVPKSTLHCMLLMQISKHQLQYFLLNAALTPWERCHDATLKIQNSTQFKIQPKSPTFFPAVYSDIPLSNTLTCLVPTALHFLQGTFTRKDEQAALEL
jgi:hypothetical protein